MTKQMNPPAWEALAVNKVVEVGTDDICKIKEKNHDQLILLLCTYLAHFGALKDLCGTQSLNSEEA